MIFYFRVYSTKTIACKWKMLVWAFLVDTTRVNVQNLAGLTHPQKYAMKDGKLKVSSVQFGNQAYLIVNTFGLSNYTTKAAYDVTGNPSCSHSPSTPNIQQGQCLRNERKLYRLLDDIQGVGYRGRGSSLE